MGNMKFKGVVGEITNPYRQNYDDTCAIKSQQLILKDFGIAVTEEQCVQYSKEHGWYSGDGSGTNMNDVGKLLNDAGIPCTQAINANVYDLVKELAQGHKVIVGVDSGELWNGDVWDNLKDFFLGDTPDHALIVAGIDMTDPENPMVIVTDPGTGNPSQPYPLEQFMDAWSDSNCFMVSTNIATPAAFQKMVINGLVDGHLDEIAGVDYNTFVHFQDYSHNMTSIDQAHGLYDMFQQFPSMNIPFDTALVDYGLPPFDPAFVSPMTNYVDPFSFDYNILHNTNWLFPDNNLQPVTDMFGHTRMVNPMDVDIMSGIPLWEIPLTTTETIRHQQNVEKLDTSHTLEQERDLAVRKYHEAMDCGNYEEALRWENIADSHQQSLYDLWDTPQYGLPAKAPGID